MPSPKTINREDVILKTSDVLIRVLRLEQGSSTGWHHHSVVSDFVVCFSGEVEVETKNPEQSKVLLPGQRYRIEPMQLHCVKNTSAKASEYLLVQGIGSYDFIPYR